MIDGKKHEPMETLSIDVPEEVASKAVNLVSQTAEKADYQKQTTDESESQFDMIKQLELDFDAHKNLIEYCKERKIMFMHNMKKFKLNTKKMGYIHNF